MRWGERKPGPLGSGWCRVASMQQVRSPRTVGLEKLAESGPHAGTGQGGGRGRRRGGGAFRPCGRGLGGSKQAGSRPSPWFRSRVLSEKSRLQQDLGGPGGPGSRPSG